MTDPTPDTAPPPDDSLAAMLRGDQRLRWLQGNRIPVEAYLDHYPELRGNLSAVQSLLLGEIQLRRELREPVELNDFCRRFPGFEAWLAQQFHQLGSTSATPSAPAEELPEVR